MLKQQSVGFEPNALTEIDLLIKKLCGKRRVQNDPLSEALDHHLGSGGQRTRARLSLACSQSLGLKKQDAVALACTTESLHSASLVQDDYQDRSSTRRGRKSVWKKFGPDTALCLTDQLISSAFAALSSVSENQNLALLIEHTHEAISETLRGQMLDTGPNKSVGSRLEASLEIAAAKSSPFFALALVLPLIVAGYEQDLNSAKKACHHFGIGYQTYDDLQDLEQDEREGNDKNIVLAIGQPDGISLPVIQASKLAVYHLKQAASHARVLPNDCGRLLYGQAESLQNEISDLT